MPPWLKQISKVLKPEEIDILDQYATFLKTDHAIRQEIIRQDYI